MTDEFAPTPELIRMAQQAKADHDARESGQECKHIPDNIKKKRLRVTAECSTCGKDLLFVKGGGKLPTMWMALTTMENRK